MVKGSGTWNVTELHDMLDRFEIELREVGLKENSIETYIGRSRFFVRWLDDDFHPRGPNK
jgi:hypothetical protein